MVGTPRLPFFRARTERGVARVWTRFQEAYQACRTSIHQKCRSLGLCPSSSQDTRVPQTHAMAELIRSAEWCKTSLYVLQRPGGNSEIVSFFGILHYDVRTWEAQRWSPDSPPNVIVRKKGEWYNLEFIPEHGGSWVFWIDALEGLVRTESALNGGFSGLPIVGVPEKLERVYRSWGLGATWAWAKAYARVCDGYQHPLVYYVFDTLYLTWIPGVRSLLPGGPRDISSQVGGVVQTDV